MLLLARVLPLVRMSAILDHIWGSKGPKSYRKGILYYYMHAELRQKVLKTFNLTSTNAILMKLITIMYHPESLNQKPPIARNSIFGVIS